MNPKRLFLLTVFAYGILAGGLQPPALAAGRLPSQPTASLEEATRNPRIVPGDTVSVTVEPAEEYNRDVTVQPDGKVELPLIGSIKIQDYTAKELEKVLEEKFSKYVEAPKVAVAVRSFSGRKIAILGEVRSAGYYPYRDGMKLLELVALAGGASELARTRKVQVLRQGGTQKVTFNFQAVLDGDLSRDLVLVPGDVIYFPKTVITKKASWLTINVLPWLSFATLAVSVAVLAK